MCHLELLNRDQSGAWDLRLQNVFPIRCPNLNGFKGRLNEMYLCSFKRKTATMDGYDSTTVATMPLPKERLKHGERADKTV